MPPSEREVAVGVRATYDAIARAYAEQLGDELADKPVDRALLDGFVELAGAGRIGDVGCGPGHVTEYLAARNADVIGIDLSPGMIAAARQRAPDLAFAVGSMLDLPAADGAWAGAVAMYSVIHLTAGDRVTAAGEFARVVRAGGWLLVSFHIDSAAFAMGAVNHLTNWFGESVEIDGYFLDPAEVAADLESAGFAVMAQLIRQPSPDVEYPSRRCYLLGQRR